MGNQSTLVIGSRGSALALWQANYVAARLQRLATPTRIEIIKTTGDHLQTASLVQAGGKGLFTKEIEEALLSGEIDLAVHSLKDLPTTNPEGLTIAGIPEREDPLDAIVGSTLAELPRAARVGTSSSRRAAQLLALRPDLKVNPVRGNVDTRLGKLDAGSYDAILLAAAGLRRLGLHHRISEVFSPEQICPAPGQGALAIQTRESGAAREICLQMDHEATRIAVTAERAVLAELGGGCQLPVGVFARLDSATLDLQAVVISPDGATCLRARHQRPPAQHHALASLVVNDLLRQGAASLLQAGVA